MKKIISLLILGFALFGIVKTSKAYSAVRTFALNDNCVLQKAYNDDYTTFNSVLGQSRFYAPNYYSLNGSAAIICTLPNEYMPDYYDQPYEWNQDNFSSVTFQQIVNYGSAYAYICEVPHNPSSTTVCSNSYAYVYYTGTTTLTLVGHYSNLVKGNGVPVLVIIPSSNATSMYFSTFRVIKDPM